MEYIKGTFLVSTDRLKLDFETIHDFLQQFYSARGIPPAVVRRSIDNCPCFGIDIYVGRSPVEAR